jgi:hypothetical protein
MEKGNKKLKTYCKPKLLKHGDLKEITQVKKTGSGDGIYRMSSPVG